MAALAGGAFAGLLALARKLPVFTRVCMDGRCGALPFWVGMARGRQEADIHKEVAVRPVRFLVSAVSTVALGASAALSTVGGPAVTQAAASTVGHVHVTCANASAMCTEVADSDAVFGHYVGHDEPSVLFESNHPGSGNHMRYYMTLPKNPSASKPTAPGKSYAFELSGAEWLGMALCDTQSFPEQVKTCPADSDKNILDPKVSPKHTGQAYMELQFYPPGWVPWPTWAVAVGASSCNPTKWCAALNIDSLALNPVTGKTLNPTCLSKVGEEYLNFAFVTKNGRTTAPANPVHSTLATFTPSARDLFMNSGDRLQVSLGDTRNGLHVSIRDLTTGGTGSMTASAANGFGQVKFAPTGSSCTNIPYNFHPMYSTSTTKTRVTWAAGSYNVAFDTEIGHFQSCSGKVAIPDTPFGLDAKGNPTTCPTGDTENTGTPADNNPATGDDFFCFPAKEALVYKVAGCAFTNTGFDGTSYQKVWPNGNTRLHPTPFQFTSPETGPNFNVQYQQIGLEADLPAIEAACNPNTGAGCTLIPKTDKNKPVAFYPFYSITRTRSGCYWQFGNVIPGEITAFGKNAQYGKLLGLDYTTVGGGTQIQINDFRQIFTHNVCPQGRQVR
jgi:hypothetical protein